MKVAKLIIHTWRRQRWGKFFRIAAVGAGLLAAWPAQGQWSLQGYFEEEVSPQVDNRAVINMGVDGVLLLRKQSKPEGPGKEWSLLHVDTAMQSQPLQYFTADIRYELLGYDTTAHSAFILFSKSEFSLYEVEVAHIDMLEKKTTWFTIKHESEFTLTHLATLPGTILLGGYVSKRPMFMFYNIGSNQMRILPGMLSKGARLLDMRANKSGSFNMLTLEETPSRNAYVAARVVGPQGQLLIYDSAMVREPLQILSGIISELRREELVAVGLYTRRSNRKALGYYTLAVDPLSESVIKYYSFDSLKHFFEYLPLEKASRIVTRAKERRAAGKESDYLAYVNPLRMREGPAGFALLAEMLTDTPGSGSQSNNYPVFPYYSPYGPYNIPPYGYGPFPYGGGYYGPYGNPYGPYGYGSPYYGGSSRNEVYYTQLLMTLFDGKGRLVWDSRMAVERMLYQNNDWVSDFVLEGDSLHWGYKRDEFIVGGAFALENSGAQRLDTMAVVPTQELEVLLREYPSGAEFFSWYGRRFFVCGYRNVRRAVEGGEDGYNKRVFYIGKL